MHKHFCFIFIVFFCFVSLMAQEKLTIKGVVISSTNKKIDLVNVSVKDQPGGSVTNTEGEFTIVVNDYFPLVLVFSRIGFAMQEVTIDDLEDIKELNIVLQEKQESIIQVDVVAKEEGNQNFTTIDSNLSATLPDATGGAIEALVKTQMGVSSNNELSSQYRVRGGNFDENMVYVNDIEVYRPFLISSGQQEGLSFVNPELVSDIRFSAGGFDARYGDKMSSVLDIKYKSPTAFAGHASGSLLGASTHIEGVSKNEKITHITGIRYKTNKYLLGTLDVSGDYEPTFFDAQTYLTYRINDRWRLGVLGNVSLNQYNFEPEDRETTFGTLAETKTLTIYFEGQEEDEYLTGFAAASLDFSPDNNNNFKFIFSGYRTSEDESYDILGQYWLQDVGEEDEDGNINYDSDEDIGIGSYLEHARNYLFGSIYNFALRGAHMIGPNHLEWEVKYQHERFSDIINEWELIDSADYSIPYSEDDLELSYAYNDEHDISSNRITTFIQENRRFDIAEGTLDLALGVRASYWDFNEELLLSPRLSVLFNPNWERDYRFRFSTGYYYQSPFYKEYREKGVGINYHIKSQKSIHFVTGLDYYFLAWERPFKFSTEMYYKILKDLNPYDVDNVRIEYSAKNNARGYAVGWDMKINGEFVEGVESWASLSLMKTEENLVDDSYVNDEGETVYPGYIPRPSDQRLNFSLMFQDYLRNNRSFKVNLNFLYGTGLPFGPPDSPRYMATYRMPSYRRVDIGFSKEITGSQLNTYKKATTFKSIWIGLEIFNLLDIDNTISYYWVTDTDGTEYAVPNYLTSRRLNVKLVTRF